MSTASVIEANTPAPDWQPNFRSVGRESFDDGDIVSRAVLSILGSEQLDGQQQGTGSQPETTVASTSNVT